MRKPTCTKSLRTPGLCGKGFFTVNPEEPQFEYVFIICRAKIKNDSFSSQILRDLLLDCLVVESP
jgi:hypothetical protein